MRKYDALFMGSLAVLLIATGLGIAAWCIGDWVQSGVVQGRFGSGGTLSPFSLLPQLSSGEYSFKREAQLESWSSLQGRLVLVRLLASSGMPILLGLLLLLRARQLLAKALQDTSLRLRGTPP